MSLIMESDSFYRASHMIDPERYGVTDPSAEAFTGALGRLVRNLDSESSEPPWDRVIAAARGTKWRAATEPVPFSSRFSGAAEPLAVFLRLAPGLVGTLEGHRQALLEDLIGSANAYMSSDNLSYANAVRECLNDGEKRRTCLVTVGGRAAAAIRGWFEEVGEDYPVLIPREFMGGRQVWDLAIIAGAGAWLPPQLLTTPRANQMTLVHPGWVRDQRRFHGVFGENATSGISATVREPRQVAHVAALDEEAADAGNVPPAPDWRAVTTSVPMGAPGDDVVEARLAVLSGGYGVLLPVQGEHIRGLDPTAPPGERVLNLKIASIVAGSILLLREGGTDVSLVRDLARNDLRLKFEKIQRLQHEWKVRLSQRIAQMSMAAVKRELLARGAKTANLAYWISEDCLRPRRDFDFEVLLRYVGIEEIGSRLDAANELLNAHHRAGRALTRALEHQVEAVELTPLEIHGIQQLHPEGAPDGATMTAFRVTGMSESVFKTPRHSTRRPFITRGAEWLE